MSAWMCSDDHIIAVALQSMYRVGRVGLHENERNIDREELQRRVSILETQNKVSLNARYSDEVTEPEINVLPVGKLVPRLFDRVVMTKNRDEDKPTAKRMDALLLDLGQMTTFVQCYEYQACEDQGWETSEARKLCDQAYRNIANNIVGGGDSWGTYP